MADNSPRFGFVGFAETWNGRLAMLGFVIGLATELLTGQGILSQIGLGLNGGLFLACPFHSMPSPLVMKLQILGAMLLPALLLGLWLHRQGFW